ncbi:hypothetical protein [Kamptonema formosum]|uniref:hypothetical protein n=1 Tax=Kamptonema formosum TaxID=331992 RepID=UPI0003488C8B|nr:hypothetical protein [Oscillatoria sp. PCC 10802]
MSFESFKVYAPNVHLFAFQLRSDADASELLWEKCREIWPKFHLSPPLKIRDVPQGKRVDMLESATEENSLLPLEGKISLPSEETRIVGSAYPLQIYDSFALWLNLCVPKFDENSQPTEEVETSFFHNFNPDGCFLANNIKSNLGQTLLLTVWLSPEDRQKNRSHWRKIAAACLRSFFGKKTPPPLYQEGDLFGSPIFEYGNPTQPDERGDIFVWLFFRESDAEDTFNYFAQEFTDLFFYRQKAIQAYRLSREVHQDIKERYQQLKQTIEGIAPKLPQPKESGAITAGGLSAADLSDFQHKLRIFPTLNLEYADLLGELERYRLTIEVNSKNYATNLKPIQEKLPDSDLRFLSEFHLKLSQKFQEQIQVDLGYFGQRADLVDKAISAIRGLVEIEQAKRESDLQNTIQAVGAGIGAGVGVAGIVASSYPLLKEPWQLPSLSPPFLPLHPFLVSFFLSLLVGAGLGWLTWRITKSFLNKAAK